MAIANQPPRTLAEKVWSDHVVVPGPGEGEARQPDLIYIDLHLVHEVTSRRLSTACAWRAVRSTGRI